MAVVHAGVIVEVQDEGANAHVIDEANDYAESIPDGPKEGLLVANGVVKLHLLVEVRPHSLALRGDVPALCFMMDEDHSHLPQH